MLLAHYDSMFSSKFCGSKAVDFVGSLANTLVVVLPEQEIAEVLSGHDQTMRRLATAIRRRSAAAGGCQIKNVSVLICGGCVLCVVCSPPSLSPSLHSTVPQVFFLSTREGSAGSSSEEVIQAFDGIWGDVCVEDAGSARISPPSLTVLGVNVKDAESLASAKAAVLLASSSADVLGAEEQKSQTLGSKIFEAWAMVSSGIPRAIFSPSQRQSVYAIESAFAVGIAQSEAAFNQWQARIGSGKVVGKFGSRVQELLDAVHKRFMEQTKGSVSVRERALRARQLRENIESVANVLFRQQISLLQTQITKQFRRSLISLAVSGGNNEEEAKTEAQSKEEEQQVRKALFDFRALALELEVESIGLVSNAAQTELSTALQTMATEFPESSFGRLEAVKKLERETKRPKKKGKKGVKGAKGKRAINIGLNLVGMLRPPGYGNLQGFVGYSTALLGLPFEILMGVQNDGDSPEVCWFGAPCRRRLCTRDCY